MFQNEKRNKYDKQFQNVITVMYYAPKQYKCFCTNICIKCQAVKRVKVLSRKDID